jgi:pimeloyl-ACP methyl ester carboxylesterase
VWLPVFDLLSKHFEVFVPEHPGFGTSDNPPWMRNIGDLAMYYLDFIEEMSAHPVHLVGQSLGGWAAAEVAVRNCTRLKSLSLLGPAGIRIKGMPAGDNFIWDAEESVRNLYFNQKITDQTLSMQLTDEQADILLTNRFAATKFGWEPRWYNPSLERWLHRITVPTLIVWGKED